MQTKPDLTVFLGKHVSVTVDRPLGSQHPHHPDIIYPVNYGYVSETLSGDGMPVDAYVLGVYEPVSSAEGIVIAVITRLDDTEDKLVVASQPHEYTVEEIKHAVTFQEQYFQSRVVVTSDFTKIADYG